VGELGSVAVSLPRQVRLRRWAWGLEWCHFGGEAEVCEYAPDRERVGDGGEQGAVAVAVWAAQDVLVEYAREKFRPAIAGGACVELGGGLGRLGCGPVAVHVFGINRRRPRHDEVTQGGRGCEDSVVGELVFAWVREDGD